MGNQCKGVCHREKGARRRNAPGLYERGFVYCPYCAIFLPTPARFCPCCGGRLRRRTRKSLTRKRSNAAGRLHAPAARKCAVCARFFSGRPNAAKTCSAECSRTLHRRATDDWNRANPGKVLASKKKWMAANPEKVREAGRRAAKRWYAANREKASAYQRRWYAANREKVLAALRARDRPPRKSAAYLKAMEAVAAGGAP